MAATRNPPSVAVLGGGMAGLAAAHRLRALGARPTVIEEQADVGGVVGSERRSGYLVECGPNSVQSRPALDQLVQDLSLEGERVYAAPEARKRYVVRHGTPVPLPTSPRSFLQSPLLSPRAKLRLLAEPFVRRGPHPSSESVAGFVRRRLGPEALDYAVDPFIAGVFAGDPERLSVRLAFPTLTEMEALGGSLVGGAVRLKRARKASGDPPPDRRSFSFREGLGVLPAAIARTLEGAIRTGLPVRSVRHDGTRWRVTADGREEAFDAVVCTLPLHRLPDVAFEPAWDRTPLEGPHYAPVAVVALGYRRDAIGHPLDGFGVLVPKREPFRLLGALFSSTLFPGRAPADHALLTCFVGGSRHPEDAALPTSDLLALVQHDLDALLDAVGQPTLVLEQRWPQAIPQYGLGYTAVLDALDAAEAALPAFRFAGNFRGGIALGDAVTSGFRAAEAVLEALGYASPTAPPDAR